MAEVGSSTTTSLIFPDMRRMKVRDLFKKPLMGLMMGAESIRTQPTVVAPHLYEDD